MVRILLPGLFERVMEGDEALDIAKAFAERHEFHKYRLLDQGIAVVTELGLQPAIRFYREYPRQFKSLLTSKKPAMPDEDGDKTAEAPDDDPAA